MNYRHVYHAGNFADVLKHAVLVWCVRYLQQKDAPICVVDTHGGSGLYDLRSKEALKTNEAAHGILRVAQARAVPPEFAPYLGLVRRANHDLRITRYPGSPWLMAQMLRERDRAVIGELHPEDAIALRSSLRDTARVRIVEGDGYAMLSTNVPPPEKRGLVLIDPPFEATDEFEILARSLIAAQRKWATGMYLVWHPIKDRAAIDRFHAELKNAGIEKMVQITLEVDGEEGLAACGLLAINAPWTLERDWQAPLRWLADRLSRGPSPSAVIAPLS
jgi:23S rRNA (adenine2030-N6)-methyltransferase